MVVYPWETAKKKLGQPVALERLQALALFWVPQDNTAALPAARENLAVERKGDRPDTIAAMFKRQGTHM